MSEDSIPDLDQNTAEFFINLTKDLISGTITKLDSKITELESSLETLEKQIATLVVGYGEQAAFIEALTGQIAFASEDARTAFHNTLQKTREQMLQVMKNESEHFLGDENPRLATTISDLAESQLSGFGE
jgi:chromosome segregation ATPase